MINKEKIAKKIAKYYENMYPNYWQRIQFQNEVENVLSVRTSLAVTFMQKEVAKGKDEDDVWKEVESKYLLREDGDEDEFIEPTTLEQAVIEGNEILYEAESS